MYFIGDLIVSESLAVFWNWPRPPQISPSSTQPGGIFRLNHSGHASTQTLGIGHQMQQKPAALPYLLWLSLILLAVLDSAYILLHPFTSFYFWMIQFLAPSLGLEPSCKGIVAAWAELAVAPNSTDAVQLLWNPPPRGILKRNDIANLCRDCSFQLWYCRVLEI